MKKVLAFLLALWPLAATGARAAPDCQSSAKVEAPIAGPLQPLRRVENYRVILQSCSFDGKQKLAIRSMRVDGEELLLAVDPQSLETSVEHAACWTCGETQGSSRFLRAVEAEPEKKP